MVIASFGLCWMAWPVERNCTAGVCSSVSAIARAQLMTSTATKATRQTGSAGGPARLLRAVPGAGDRGRRAARRLAPGRPGGGGRRRAAAGPAGEDAGAPKPVGEPAIDDGDREGHRQGGPRIALPGAPRGADMVQ